LPKTITVLLDENMPGAEAFKHAEFLRVANAIGFRGNGWAGLSDDKVILEIKKMADSKPAILFVLLTRDLGFIEDSRCVAQKIDIRYGNLRILELSWETFYHGGKPFVARDFGSIDKTKVLKVLKSQWPKVLNKVMRN
jgi:hypothetical protein